MYSPRAWNKGTKELANILNLWKSGHTRTEKHFASGGKSINKKFSSLPLRVVLILVSDCQQAMSNNNRFRCSGTATRVQYHSRIPLCVFICFWIWEVRHRSRVEKRLHRVDHQSFHLPLSEPWLCSFSEGVGIYEALAVGDIKERDLAFGVVSWRWKKKLSC